MKIKALNHIAISTKDIVASITFYNTILGFTLLEEQEDTLAKYAFMSMDGAFMIELIQWKDERPSVSSCTIDHIALDVDDVVAAEQTLKEYGVAPIESPCELEKFNTRLLKITDPNGICIALRENII